MVDNYLKIKNFLTELANIWGKNFPYSWSKEERAREIINTWVKYIGQYSDEVLQKVLDKIVSSKVEACGLPEIASLCKTEDRKMFNEKMQMDGKVNISQHPSNSVGFCPWCNTNVTKDQVSCLCGWKVNLDSIMSHQCPFDLFAMHKPFIDKNISWKRKD